MSEISKRIYTSIFLVLLLLSALNFPLILYLSLLIIYNQILYEFNIILSRIFNARFKLVCFIYIFFTNIYILLFLIIIFLYLNEVYNLNQIDLIIVICVCISTDIGGYIFGKTFKGKKLTKISPKKTYSGMIGSFITSIFVIFLFFSQFYSDAELLLITVLLSLISQIGDLSISFIKRKSKLKNTGSILPGHGGLLDRLDGFIFAIPFSVFIFKII